MKAGLSIGALARATDLSKTSVSNIESGVANPSLETMWRLANALGVTLGALLGEESAPNPHVTKVDEGAVFEASSGLRGHFLSSARREHMTDVMELVFDRSMQHQSTAHLPGTEEFLICTQGAISAGPTGQESEIKAGEAMWFLGDRSHSYRTRRKARAILLMIYPVAARPILVSGIEQRDSLRARGWHNRKPRRAKRSLKAVY